MVLNPAVLGGPGVIVEIDESLWRGRRKYNRGRNVSREGWVFGCFDRSTKKVAMFEVKDRTAATLMEKIEKHIMPGSVIYSDEWPAYSAIHRAGVWKHMTVNHSENFVDPATGVHTQNIEGFWGNAKSSWKKMRGCNNATAA